MESDKGVLSLTLQDDLSIFIGPDIRLIVRKRKGTDQRMLLILAPKSLRITKEKNTPELEL
jgi:hypothetical protein